MEKVSVFVAEQYYIREHHLQQLDNMNKGRIDEDGVRVIAKASTCVKLRTTVDGKLHSLLKAFWMVSLNDFMLQ